METKMKWATAALALFGLTAVPATAAVIDLINLQAAHVDLIHQWTFQGETDSARLQNKKGSTHMRVWNRDWTLDPDQGDPGSAEDPVQEFVQGFDATTLASRSYTDGLNNTSKGSALRSVSPNIIMPNEGTVEFMVYHHEALTYGSSLAGGGGTDNRWYFSQGDRVLIGPNQTTGILFPTLQENRWFYGAVTWSIAEDPYEAGHPNAGKYAVTVNGWYADLSGDNPFTLTQSITAAETWITDPAQGIVFGIGGVAGSSSLLDGMTDAVAMYNAILSEETLQAHVSAIPEPGTASLLLGGVLAAGILVRRRKWRGRTSCGPEPRPHMTW